MTEDDWGWDESEFECPICKTTDVVPTLLDLLGINPHWSVVGNSILNYK